ncbi:GNAT family N-acetyltransferase [Alteromonas sp. ASW11-130]|uniref:GNAT family N-acetyltransferase n=1 Tax=Alteromonas sp. ASW11-130 TaxID=3015775 RepID=UPI002241F1A2|nr:GNAT family N-acetyltransferase [Alteromonas sp. ASW11-130]MCW8092890.1 GNAT family N-acetyltransferase [Alteromonas sp. ASW11-130]
MALNKVIEWLFGRNIDENVNTYHRQMLVIAMEKSAGLLRAQELIDSAPIASKTCALSNRDIRTDHSKPIALYKHLLGQSYNIAIYDAVDEFRPSALLALAGCVTFQGCLVVITPPLNEWPKLAVESPPFYLTYGFNLNVSRYIQQLAKEFANNQQIAIWQHDELRLPQKLVFSQSLVQASPFWSSDQKRAFDALRIFFNSDDKYAVVKAKRGRGKSSLLGLLSASLLGQGIKILVSSTAKKSIEGLFDICTNNISRFTSSIDSLTTTANRRELKWVAPDSPLLLDNSYDLLIIDEAASFPAPLLMTICRANRKIILSTTTEGYEGSAKGFEQKVITELEKHVTVSHITLSEPLRWFKNDPLELFLSDTLLYKKSTGRTAKVESTNDPLFTFTHTSNLSIGELTQVLNLLNGAHYQTTPDDLMRLTDSPDIYYALLRNNQDEIIAAAAINVEGGRSLSPIASEICSGNRRVKGHLSAQGLAYFCAQEAVTTQSYWRINRIAVWPNLQGNGLGSRLLTYVSREADKQYVDALTSSFGATVTLIDFWKNNGFMLLKVGKKRNKASALSSALVVSPMNEEFSRLASTLSMLGFNDARFDGIEAATLSKFAIIDSEQTCLDVYYQSRWRQFCYRQRNLMSLSSAMPWLLHQIRGGAIHVSTAVQDELITLLTTLAQKHNVNTIDKENLKKWLTPLFKPY